MPHCLNFIADRRFLTLSLLKQEKPRARKMMMVVEPIITFFKKRLLKTFQCILQYWATLYVYCLQCCAINMNFLYIYFAIITTVMFSRYYAIQ